MRKIPQMSAFVLIFLCILAATSSLQLARAYGPIYIRADGTVDPPEAPIQRNGDLYTLTDNIMCDVDGIIIEKSDITIDGGGHTVQGGTTGNAFYLYGVSNATIRNTRIDGFSYGIYLESTSQNSIYGNNITGSTYDGIGLYDSSGNTVSINNVKENGWSGVGLYYSSENNINENYITNNYYGINFFASQNNSIFHNNFVSNTNQTSSDGSPNSWDDAYPSGGNYWSDHTGPDNYRGPSQNQANSDGIYDTAYIIDTSNQDNYPLTKPYGGVHDIGIAEFSATKTVITQNYNPNITTKAINYGINSENFSIEVYMNATMINQTQITLQARDSVIITFTWNTTGLSRAKYNITAIAGPVSGETDTSDNTCESWIVITVQGDITADGSVDILDAIALANYFNSTPDGPEWNPNADLNDDNIIDILDAIILANNFGATS